MMSEAVTMTDDVRLSPERKRQVEECRRLIGQLRESGEIPPRGPAPAADDAVATADAGNAGVEAPPAGELAWRLRDFVMKGWCYPRDGIRIELACESDGPVTPLGRRDQVEVLIATAVREAVKDSEARRRYYQLRPQEDAIEV